MHASTEIIKRLESKRHIDRNGCWLWRGQKNQKGYGRISIKGKLHSVHRISWWIFKDSKPLNQVLHKCDVRSCFNPNHLFIGTPKENTADMLSKSREARGEMLPQSKLKTKDVVKIRLLPFDLAKKHAVKRGVSIWTVYDIRSGRSWKHIA